MSTDNAIEASVESMQTQHGGHTNFQNMDEFMKEQDEIDALNNARQAQPKIQLGLVKKPKTVDVEALVFESRAVEELGNDNWVGKLVEYRAANPTADGGLTYAETTVTSQVVPRFQCTVVISESSQQFGGNTISFSNKKDAKRYASKKAVDWLIENKRMPSDGSIRFPKASVVSSLASTSTTGGQAKAITFAGQVPELSIRLGFNPPMYEIERAAGGAPLYNVYAHFSGDPRADGKIGEVTNIYGRKNAKEKCAEMVLSFLRDIERRRLQE